MKKNQVTRIFFIVSLLAVCLFSYLFYNRLQSLLKNYYWVNHTLEVTHGLEKYLRNILDAETESRGFLLTQDFVYLEPFKSAVNKYQDNYNFLLKKFQDNPVQIRNLIKLDSLSRLKISLMEKRFNERVYKKDNIKYAEALMDNIKETVNKMLELEDKYLKERQFSLNYSLLITPIFLLILTLFFLGLLVFSFLHILRESKRNASLLTEQKEFVETIINSAEEWIAVYDKNLTVTLLNDSSAKMMGVKKEEVIGKTLYDLYSEASRKKSEDDLKRVFEGEVIKNEPYLSSMSHRWVQNYITPLRNKQGQIYAALGIAQDVTGIIQSQSELRKSQEHFSLLFNVSPVAKSISRTGDGTVINVNPAWEKMFNKRKEDVIGKNSMELGMTDQGDRADRVSLIKDKGGNLEGTELRFDVGNGNYVHAYVSVVTLELDGVECYLTAYFNLTQRKYAEEQLKLAVKMLAEKNLELEEAQRLSHIGSWDWDIIENNLSWSDELYKIFGVKPGEFEPTIENGMSMVHPDDRETINELLEEAFNNKVDSEYTYRIIQPNGNIRVIFARGEIFTDKNNNIVRMTGTAQDITETAQMTASLEQKNADLEKMNNELASFTYIASHDLQEPLRKIQMFTKRIADNEAETLSDKAKDYFQRIDRSASRMQHLIEDLLSYSRTTNTIKKFEEVNLNDILLDVKENLKEAINATNADIKSNKLPTIYAIPYQMRQLFTNLISNSIKFTAEGIIPEIQINYSIVDSSRLNNEDGFQHLNYHKLSFKDNGIGFEPQFNEQIFGLFQRLHGKTEYEGTGIGLAICKKIIENHNGIIVAKGEKGEGAIFEVYIPFN